MLDVEWSWRLACEGIPATQVLWEIEPLEDLPAVTTYWRAEGERLLARVQALPPGEFEREVTPNWMTQSYPVKHILQLWSHNCSCPVSLGLITSHSAPQSRRRAEWPPPT